MRRLLVLALLGLGVAAPGAGAATVAREGNALVVRTVTGAADDVSVTFAETDTKARFYGSVVPGAGCAQEPGGPLQSGGGTPDTPASCDTAGVTRVSMLLGDGADQVAITGSRLPVLMDLGPGDDRLSAVDAGVVFASLGDGRDVVDDFTGRTAAFAGEGGDDRIVLGKPGDKTRTLGRSALDGGPGDDVLTSIDVPAKVTGGAGDDVLTTTGSTRDELRCAGGADLVRADPADRPGTGCPPHLGALRKRFSTLADLSRRTGRLVLRGGRISEPGRLTLRLRRATSTGDPGQTVARATLTVRAGALRGSVRPTAAGRRLLRAIEPGRRLEVVVDAVLRPVAGGGDREVQRLRAYLRR